MKFTQRVKFLHSIDGVISLDFFFKESNKYNFSVNSPLFFIYVLTPVSRVVTTTEFDLTTNIGATTIYLLDLTENSAYVSTPNPVETFESSSRHGNIQGQIVLMFLGIHFAHLFQIRC